MVVGLSETILKGIIFISLSGNDYITKKPPVKKAAVWFLMNIRN